MGSCRHYDLDKAVVDQAVVGNDQVEGAVAEGKDEGIADEVRPAGVGVAGGTDERRGGVETGGVMPSAHKSRETRPSPHPTSSVVAGDAGSNSKNASR